MQRLKNQESLKIIRSCYWSRLSK